MLCTICTCVCLGRSSFMYLARLRAIAGGEDACIFGKAGWMSLAPIHCFKRCYADVNVHVCPCAIASNHVCLRTHRYPYPFGRKVHANPNDLWDSLPLRCARIVTVQGNYIRQPPYGGLTAGQHDGGVLCEYCPHLFPGGNFCLLCCLKPTSGDGARSQTTIILYSMY